MHKLQKIVYLQSYYSMSIITGTFLVQLKQNVKQDHLLLKFEINIFCIF